MTRGLSTEERDQAAHFDSLAEDYERHYSDPFSNQWRRRCVNHRLTHNLSLAGLRVLDVMCGGGENTEHFNNLGARLVGADISKSMVHKFRQRWPQGDVVCASALDLPFATDSFDHVVITAGLHHVFPAVDRAVDEVYRVLKPGGRFVFLEPHAGSIPDLLRKAWYRLDPLFESNEKSIDPERLWRAHATQFEREFLQFGGGLACLLVNHSLMFRMPLAAKRIYAPLLIELEARTERLIGRRTGLFAIGQWRKRMPQAITA